MYKWSKSSKKRLESCHPDLQRIFNHVIKYVDCKVTDGHRGEEKQNEYFALGKSQKKWPESGHNKIPSEAIDVVPYPVNWTNVNRFYMFVGYVRAVADRMGIKIKTGADWDGDWLTSDQTFNDLPHYRLIIS